MLNKPKIVKFTNPEILELEAVLDQTEQYLIQNAPELAVNNVPENIQGSDAVNWILEHMMMLANNMSTLPDQVCIQRDICNIYADCSQLNKYSLPLLYQYYSTTPVSTIEIFDVMYTPLDYDAELIDWCNQCKDVLNAAKFAFDNDDLQSLYNAVADLNILTANILNFKFRV